MGLFSVNGNRLGEIAKQLHIQVAGPDTSLVGAGNQSSYQLEDAIKNAGHVAAQAVFDVDRQVVGGFRRMSDADTGQAALIRSKTDGSSLAQSAVIVVPSRRHLLAPTEKVVIDGVLSPEETAMFSRELSPDDLTKFFGRTIEQAIKMTINGWNTLENLTVRKEQYGS